MRTTTVAMLASAMALAAASAHAEVNWANVDQALGRASAAQPDGVHRFSMPRSDLKVTLGGVDIKPGFALGSWLGFQPMDGDQVMVMGDLVLTQKEVNPVMKKLLDGGIDVTALHNHLINVEPFPMYMHVEAKGDPVKIATALRDALALSATPAAAPAAPAQANPDIGFPTDPVATAMGRKGTVDGGLYKYNIARRDPVQDHGMVVPITMGTGISINFEATGGGNAATTGDFVLAADEVAPVMRALKDHGLDVTALHSHMVNDDDMMFFMHFWGEGKPDQLALGLKAALDNVAVKPAD